MSSRSASYGALVLRLALGMTFIAHSFQSLFSMTLPGTARFFLCHGYPGWLAYPVCFAQLVGGIGLIIGAHVRSLLLGLTLILAGALRVQWPNGWFFAAPNGGWEFITFLIAACLTQFFLGAGAFSVDEHCGRKWRLTRMAVFNRVADEDSLEA